jgi:hypothetical protein
MHSTALTVAQYLRTLPSDRRKEIAVIRKCIKGALQKGFVEVMQYGMISYVVPLSSYPQGYLNKKDTPMPYISLASQKQYCSLYLMNIYQDKKTQQWFETEYKKSGKKLDMGKSCVRFKKADDLPVSLIAEAVARNSVESWIAVYEKSRMR